MVAARPFWRHREVFPPCLCHWKIDSKFPKCLRSIEWKWPSHKSHRRGFQGTAHRSKPRRLLPSTDLRDLWANGSRLRKEKEKIGRDENPNGKRWELQKTFTCRKALDTYDPFPPLGILWVFPGWFYSIPEKVIIRRRRQIVRAFQVVVGRPKFLYGLHDGDDFNGVFVRVWCRRSFGFLFRISFLGLVCLSTAHKGKGIRCVEWGSFL